MCMYVFYYNKFIVPNLSSVLWFFAGVCFTFLKVEFCGVILRTIHCWSCELLFSSHLSFIIHHKQISHVDVKFIETKKQERRT